MNVSRLISTIILTLYQASIAYPARLEPSPSDDFICNAGLARPDRDQTLHEQVAMTTRGAIAYYRFGKGNPLVLITGYRANLSEWNAYFLAELAKNHEVVVFDNRGIGQSPANLTDYSAPDLARDTSALIKALGFRSTTVLGWSMGGMVAQQLALDEPELIDRLVLLSSAPPGPTSIAVPVTVDAILSGRGHSNFDGVMSVLFPVAIEQRAKDCFAMDMFKPHDYAKTRVSSAVTSVQETLLQAWRAGTRTFDLLRRLDVPTLILSGTEDEVLAPQNAVILGRTIPDAKLVEIDGGGHAMMYQYPKLLADQIDAFTKSGSPQGPRLP
jgi:pimeloyl-ACP methyl ester carboxylesterase